MNRRSLLGLTFGCVSLVSGTAGAQVLGNSGDAVFGAERLFGIRGEHQRLDRDGPLQDTEIDATTTSLGLANALLPVNIPRLSFDYFVARKFSIGGAIGYSTNDFEVEGPGGSLLLNGERQTFLFAARAGYLHMFGRVLGIWPRGGLTYHSTSIANTADLSDFGVNLECLFPIVIAPHFGFLIGPAFDVSLTGKVDPDVPNAEDLDWSYRSIALQFGLFGWI